MKVFKDFILGLMQRFYERAVHKHVRLAEKYKNVDVGRWARHTTKAINYIEKRRKIYNRRYLIL